MAQYKSGDVVKLKSGGPKMTVEGQSIDKSRLTCKWFIGGDLKLGTFLPDELDLA